MLKIELIRFEAQDVITASGTCACTERGGCNQWNGYWHWLGGRNWCPGDENKNHYCGH